MRILLVEDQPQLAESLTQALTQSGYAVDTASDGEMADHLLQTEPFALVVLDIALPKMDGWTVLRRLRARGNKTLVLILTAHGSTQERVKGLDLGADDYLSKPFELNELEARVRALIRRSNGPASPQIEFGPLVYDSVSRTVEISGVAIPLTPKERAVLEVLLHRTGRVIDKDALSAQVYSLDNLASPDAIEIYIHRLRKKLAGTGVGVVTIRGLGYLLEIQPKSIAPT